MEPRISRRALAERRLIGIARNGKDGRMRVLYLCHRFPYPPRRGGKIRPFNVVRHLSERHEVTVCSLARSSAEAAEAKGIAPYCARFFVEQVRAPVQMLRMIARLPTPRPSSVGFFYSAELARRVSALL